MAEGEHIGSPLLLPALSLADAERSSIELRITGAPPAGEVTLGPGGGVNAG